ncbi:hypothetical protein BCR41DRAFT_412477 [Lobosporangium transversale]|uniref:Uncharacterized protein n=1 Tax=Lobosporangium transversale TaxID=64571 RepID=A0A1Y2GDL8_9FUNG|nr:hypothetical protein BCR41DRAFT_412477 [Lobosporangium transversale]ORZ06967.1 hypothetical protein BCR41DRAFT_412477 [Lobosporangium transversale]|eukprot:XP_021877763.1 hypothetical protein BCR41DRAFT_412477 [Lobosporangium transversale]
MTLAAQKANFAESSEIFSAEDLYPRQQKQTRPSLSIRDSRYGSRHKDPATSLDEVGFGAHVDKSVAPAGDKVALDMFIVKSDFMQVVDIKVSLVETIHVFSLLNNDDAFARAVAPSLSTTAVSSSDRQSPERKQFAKAETKPRKKLVGTYVTKIAKDYVSAQSEESHANGNHLKGYYEDHEDFRTAKSLSMYHIAMHIPENALTILDRELFKVEYMFVIKFFFKGRMGAFLEVPIEIVSKYNHNRISTISGAIFCATNSVQAVLPPVPTLTKWSESYVSERDPAINSSAAKALLLPTSSSPPSSPLAVKGEDKVDIAEASLEPVNRAITGRTVESSSSKVARFIMNTADTKQSVGLPPSRISSVRHSPPPEATYFKVQQQQASLDYAFRETKDISFTDTLKTTSTAIDQTDSTLNNKDRSAVSTAIVSIAHRAVEGPVSIQPSVKVAGAVVHQSNASSLAAGLLQKEPGPVLEANTVASKKKIGDLALIMPASVPAVRTGTKEAKVAPKAAAEEAGDDFTLTIMSNQKNYSDRDLSHLYPAQQRWSGFSESRDGGSRAYNDLIAKSSKDLPSPLPHPRNTNGALTSIKISPQQQSATFALVTSMLPAMSLFSSVGHTSVEESSSSSSGNGNGNRISSKSNTQPQYARRSLQQAELHHPKLSSRPLKSCLRERREAIPLNVTPPNHRPVQAKKKVTFAKGCTPLTSPITHQALFPGIDFGAISRANNNHSSNSSNVTQERHGYMPNYPPLSFSPPLAPAMPLACSPSRGSTLNPRLAASDNVASAPTSTTIATSIVNPNTTITTTKGSHARSSNPASPYHPFDNHPSRLSPLEKQNLGFQIKVQSPSRSNSYNNHSNSTSRKVDEVKEGESSDEDDAFEDDEGDYDYNYDDNEEDEETEEERIERRRQARVAWLARYGDAFKQVYGAVPELPPI